MADRSHPVLLTLPEDYKPLGLIVGTTTKSEVMRILEEENFYLISKEEPTTDIDGVMNPNCVMFSAEGRFEFLGIQFSGIEFNFYKDILSSLWLQVAERLDFTSLCSTLEKRLGKPGIPDRCNDPKCHSHLIQSANWDHGFFELNLVGGPDSDNIEVYIQDSPLVQMSEAENELIQTHFCGSCRQKGPGDPEHQGLANAVYRLKPFGLIPGKSTLQDFHTLAHLEGWKITFDSSGEKLLKGDLFNGVTVTNVSPIFELPPEEVTFYFYRSRFYSMSARIDRATAVYPAIKSRLEGIYGDCHYTNNAASDPSVFFGWTYDSIDIFIPRQTDGSTLLVMKNKAVNDLMADIEKDQYAAWLRLFEETRQKNKRIEMIDQLWFQFAEGPATDYIETLYRSYRNYGKGTTEAREPEVANPDFNETDISSLDPDLVELFLSAPGKDHLIVSLTCTISQHFIIRTLAYDFIKSGGSISVLGMKSSFTQSGIIENKQDVTFDDPADFSLNPFLVINQLDSNTLEMLVSIVGEMTFPGRHLSQGQIEILVTQMIALFKDHGPMTSFQLLSTSLKSASGREEQKLGEKISAFLKKNRRGAYFDSNPNRFAPKPLEVFEFQRFRHDDAMASVAVLSVLFNIIQNRLHKNDRKRSIVLFDGAHSLLHKGSGERFIKFAGEAVNASGGAFVISVSGFKQFKQSKPGVVLSQLSPVYMTDQPLSGKPIKAESR